MSIMQIDESWYKLYEKLYGTSFNRFLTVGNRESGYHNHNIRTLDEIRELIEEGFPKNEFYISLYNYNTDENILRWNTAEIDKYEKYAEKNGILIRFKQNTDIIKEEIANLNDIQKFMFIRRSINLGSNKDIVNECSKVYNFFKNHFNIKGYPMFNGFDECLIYYRTNEIELDHPSLTYHNIYKLLEEKLELKTILYENIEPYAQIVPLPGTQNKNSRLYTQLYFNDNSYQEIMLKSQEKFLDEEHIQIFDTSEQLEQFMKDIDAQITAQDSDGKYDFDKIWDEL